MPRGKSDQAASEPFELASSPSHLLHRAEQLAADRFTRLMGDGVTLRQFTVLAAIAAQPGLSQSNLVRATGIDRSTLAEMITRLQKRGWVSREPSAEDARAYSLRLAEPGKAILAAAAPHAKAADAAILDALPRTKGKAFLNTLTKLSAFADALAEKAERSARREAKRLEKHKRRAKEKEKKAKPRGKRA